MERSYPQMRLRFPNFKYKALTLSYDDGRDFDRKMVEIMDRYGIRGTFNLISSKIGQPGYVTAEELDTLFKNHEVAVHTLNHPHLEDLTPANICYQLIEDRKNLEDILHRPIEGMAYPYGLYEYPGMMDAVRSCGIRYARTTAFSHNLAIPRDYLRWAPSCKFDDPKLDELIAVMQKPLDPQKAWIESLKLLNIMGHSYEYEHRWDHLETMCQKLTGLDEVWYATNMEIIDYLTAYRSLRTTVDGHYVYNPTDKDLYVSTVDKKDVKNFVLHPGTFTELG